MSKRSYYYRRSRRTYPKQKWQTSVVNADVVFPSHTMAASSFDAVHSLICQTPVPLTSAAGGVVAANNIIKTGNFKVKGTYENLNTTVTGRNLNAIVYVIFVPQGITPDNAGVSVTNLATSLFYSHPEWVLGWTRIDCDSQGSNSFSITTRLKRNLNSGDSIQLGVLLINSSSSGTDSVSFKFKSTVQYAARAN